MEPLLLRPRRLRSSPALRSLVRETTLSVHDLIYPVFCIPGAGRERRPVSSMPGVFQLTVDSLRAECEYISEGIQQAAAEMGMTLQVTADLASAQVEALALPRCAQRRGGADRDDPACGAYTRTDNLILRLAAFAKLCLLQLLRDERAG